MASSTDDRFDLRAEYDQVILTHNNLALVLSKLANAVVDGRLPNHDLQGLLNHLSEREEVMAANWTMIRDGVTEKAPKNVTLQAIGVSAGTSAIGDMLQGYEEDVNSKGITEGNRTQNSAAEDTLTAEAVELEEPSVQTNTPTRLTKAQRRAEYRSKIEQKELLAAERDADVERRRQPKREAKSWKMKERERQEEEQRANKLAEKLERARKHEERTKVQREQKKQRLAERKKTRKAKADRKRALLVAQKGRKLIAGEIHKRDEQGARKEIGMTQIDSEDLRALRSQSVAYRAFLKGSTTNRQNNSTIDDTEDGPMPVWRLTNQVGTSRATEYPNSPHAASLQMPEQPALSFSTPQRELPILTRDIAQFEIKQEVIEPWEIE